MTAKMRTERGERRCRDIIEAAAEVFLDRGFAGASVDAIVERAGGSKETLYNHFGNKAGLLKAIIELNTETLFARLHMPADDTTIAVFLADIGQRYLDAVLSPRGLAIYRLVLAESGRMPELGDQFYRVGPEALVQGLALHLRAWAAAGTITLGDAHKTAAAFYALLRGELQLRALFNPARAPNTEEIATHLCFAVTSFLAVLRA